MSIKLEILEDRFSICKVADYSMTDLSDKFVFTGATDQENSLICPEKAVPGNTLERDDGWRGFRLSGTYEFSLIGILARIANILAERRISIMAVSTYNTDYVFIKAEYFDGALKALSENGYEL